MARRVLVVDDEERMRSLLRLHLQRVYDVSEAASGTEALALVARRPFDAVVLDILMPDMDGWEVCRKIREEHDTPVLMLTALSDVEDKLEAFHAGADDYLTKPFDPRELIARLEALIRRAEAGREQAGKGGRAAKSSVLAYGGLVIDLDARTVELHGEPVALTPKEFDLLAFLARSPRTAFSREELLLHVWGDAAYTETRTVDAHIKTLRGKLGRGGAGGSLVTVWGVGYKFEPAALR